MTKNVLTNEKCNDILNSQAQEKEQKRLKETLQ